MIILLSLAIILNCSPTANNKTLEDGWEKFEAGEYTEAKDIFNLLTSSEGAEAYLGLGWSNFRLNNIAGAEDNFMNASSLQDANAGQAFIQWVLENYQQTIDFAESVLQTSPAYQFNHDNSVTAEDLILHQAFSYFHLGDYNTTITKIQILNTGFTADVNALDIAEVLLTELENLKSIYQ